MSDKDTGGPAFPIQGQSFVLGEGRHTPSCPGMTLRDWFATEIDPGSVTFATQAEAEEIMGIPYPSNGSEKDKFQWQMQIVAMVRYMMADAMLKERSK